MGTLNEAIREFTQAMVNPADPDELLDRLMGHAMDVVGGVGAGILLESRTGSLEFAAASSSIVLEAEQHQNSMSSGVCYEAFSTNRTVAVADLRAVDRWPTYTGKVLSLGMQAVLGLPLVALGRTIGAMNVYRETAREWADEDIEAGEILAAMGAAYVLHVHDLSASLALTEQLQEALDSRAVIERAKGLLMARHGVDADTAFAWLRRRSMATNRKLREVATRIVQGHGSSVPPSETDPDGPEADHPN